MAGVATDDAVDVRRCVVARSSCNWRCAKRPRFPTMQQLLVVLLFMFVLPVACVVQDVAGGTADVMASVGKWFVYWGVGWRLVAAGAYQLFKPAFTASRIFEIDDPKAHALVREIAFGNLAIGIAALASLYVPSWTDGLALAGAVFYALAGIQHVRNRPVARPEKLAMVSDLAVAAVLVAYLCWRLA